MRIKQCFIGHLGETYKLRIKGDRRVVENDERRRCQRSRSRIRRALKGRRGGSGGAVQDSHVGVTSNREYSKLRCVSYIFINFAILYFTHGSSHSFPVFVRYNSCNPVSNALVELKLSAWTFQRSVIYVATTDIQSSLDFTHASSTA